jgi:hypothetical protein
MQDPASGLPRIVAGQLQWGSGTDALVVWHKPAFEDIVVCGKGFDYVLADPKDAVAPTARG